MDLYTSDKFMNIKFQTAYILNSPEDNFSQCSGILIFLSRNVFVTLFYFITPKLFMKYLVYIKFYYKNL